VNSIQELAEAAIKAITYQSSIQIDRDPVLQLIIPMKGSRQPETCFLAGRNSPKGRVLAGHGKENGKHMILVNFEAWDVLAWAIAHGAKVRGVLPDGEVIDLHETAVTNEVRHGS
jgi:hypothetical protein